MEDVFRIFYDLRNVNFNKDDDAADRINRLFSTLLLLIMATVVSARQCLGEAIHCWCPEVCASNHEKYANLMCWVDDTYYVPFIHRLPAPDEPRQRKITYYQWVPIIIMLQALLFMAPWMVWRLMGGRTGINMGTIVDAASKSQQANKPDERELALRFAVFLMDRFLMSSRRHAVTNEWAVCRSISALCVDLRGNRLFLSYIFIKALYICNSIGQIFLLDYFLGYEYHTFGYHIASYLLTSTPWIASDRFPHVTVCDFSIRQSTNVHMYTVQCVLPINIFNEKVFAIIWFWLVIVSAINVVSTCAWLVSMCVKTSQIRFVKQHLLYMDLINGGSYEQMHVATFTQRYLQRDGIFLLSLVSKNAGQMVAADILAGLWMNYGGRHQRRIAEDILSRKESKKFNKSAGKNTAISKDGSYLNAEQV